MEATDDFPFGIGFSPELSWEVYLKARQDHQAGAFLPERFVPNTFLVAEIDGTIVGRISIRHQLNDFLLREGGHLGYCVLPAYRRRGYATEILRQGLIIARSLRIDRVLVTCDDDNQGSSAVIEACGGRLDSVVDVSHPPGKLRRYWID
jgi:predicted acetyltransferase